MTLFRRTVYTLALLAAPVAAALFLQSPAAEAAAALAAISEPGESGSSFSPTQPLAPSFVAAARAARTGGFAAASSALAPELAGAEPEAGRARVVLGLLAAENGRADEAQRLLAQRSGAAGARGPAPVRARRRCRRPRRDLSGARRARGAAARRSGFAPAASEPPQARRAGLCRVEGRRRSRLHRGRARPGRAGAALRGRARTVRQPRLEDRARHRQRRPSSAKLPGACWSIPRSPPPGSRSRSPWWPSRRATGGPLSLPRICWRAPPRSCRWRCRSGALTTLEAVPLADRDFEWSLLQARALTAAQRGSEALTELSRAKTQRGRRRRARPSRARARARLLRTSSRCAAAGPPCRPPSARRCAPKGSPPCAVPPPSRPPPSSRRRRFASSTSSSRPRARSTRPSSCCISWRRSRPATRSGHGRSGSAAGASTSPATGAAPSATGASCAISTRRSPTPGAPSTGRGAPSRSWATASARWRPSPSSRAPTPPTSTPDRRRSAWREPRRPPLPSAMRSARTGPPTGKSNGRVGSRSWRSTSWPAPSSTMWPRRRMHAPSMRSGVSSSPAPGRTARVSASCARPSPGSPPRIRRPSRAPPSSSTTPASIADQVLRLAREQSLPPSLVFGIVHQESGFDPAAKSRSGARGLMQLMPSTGKEVARRLGMSFSTQRLFEPEYSLRLGTTYFRQMLGIFDNRVELALAGYNGGPGRIGRLWREQQSAGESRPLPRRAFDRRVAQLRETNSRLGRKLPEPVFRSQLTWESPIVGLRYTGFAACWAELIPGP